MSAHTPGPWKAEGRGPGLTVVFVGIKYGRRNASCALMDGTDEEREANARLIAAAPELLEALTDLAAHAAVMEELLKCMQTRTLSKARAVIAKATGESS